MSKKDDRPDFPVVSHHEVYTTGMTLRDYFAGQALMGMVQVFNDIDEEQIAELAYLQADAMLAERETNWF